MISIIIPANNEKNYIGVCLELLLKSEGLPQPQYGGSQAVQIIIVANGCTDETVAEAELLRASIEAKGWLLDILELEQGSKIKALNAGDKSAKYADRIYIDADVHVSRGLIAAIINALDRPEAAFVSGQAQIRSAKSLVSEHYARFWEQLPFMNAVVAGCGVYCVNGAGRARWEEFPDVIADDSFVRCHFAPDEMQKVPQTYSWPITENFAGLVRVRRRQNEGSREIKLVLLDLAKMTERTRPTVLQAMALFVRNPIGFLVYTSVAITVKTPLFKNTNHWQRGR